ncbi:hypothetical protein [Joostella sp. CR20]|uniref:hypothetical protein n=1 Tax=Joostella sp. CR20 TaxID=2804312 RepID=UPI00313A9FBC
MIDLKHIAKDVFESIVKVSSNNILVILPNWKNTIIENINLIESKIEKIYFLDYLYSHFIYNIPNPFDDNSEYQLSDETFEKIEDIKKFLLSEKKLLKILEYSLTEKEFLKEVVLPDEVNKFIEFEELLIDNKYLSQNRKWLGSQKELAILVCKLMRTNIFRKRINNIAFKSEQRPSNYYKELRLFFEKRYDSNFKKQFQYNRRKNYNLDVEFIFIE